VLERNKEKSNYKQKRNQQESLQEIKKIKPPYTLDKS